MFYLLNKKRGISSFEAIKQFAQKNKIQKIGHTGTLDPLATGLLLVATNDDTKLINYIDKDFKTYETTMILGKISDTYDIEGLIYQKKKVKASKEHIIKIIKSYVKSYNQIPPNYSSKKINGKRAYKLARENKFIKLAPQKVHIKKIYNIQDLGNNTYKFIVEVSRGTYIRSLIYDIGKEIGCGALMKELTRIKIGNLDIANADSEISIFDLLTIDTIKITNINKLIKGLPFFYKYKNGKFAVEYNNDIFGIVEIKNNLLKPLKLFGNKFKKIGF